MSRQRINSIVVTFLLVVLLGVIAFCGFMRLVSETRENMSSKFERNDSDSAAGEHFMQMQSVGFSGSGTYLRDEVTDVMYYYSNGICEMHDPETGLPLTYTRYQELSEKWRNRNAIKLKRTRIRSTNEEVAKYAK